jgi:hypothetical protein
LDIEAPVETSSGVFPRNEVGQFGQLLVVELIPKPRSELVAHRCRRRSQRLGVLDDQLLDVGEAVGRPPIGDGVNGVLIDAQLTAERSPNVLSPNTPDHR